MLFVVTICEDKFTVKQNEQKKMLFCIKIMKGACGNSKK